jgi:hypothetical protein
VSARHPEAYLIPIWFARYGRKGHWHAVASIYQLAPLPGMHSGLQARLDGCAGQSMLEHVSQNLRVAQLDKLLGPASILSNETLRGSALEGLRQMMEREIISTELYAHIQREVGARQCV